MRVVDLLGLWDSPWWNTPGHTSQAPVDRPTGLSLAQAQQGLAVLQNIATLRASVRGQPDEGVEMLLDEATRRVEGDGSTAFLERLMSSRHTSLNTPRLQRIQRIHDAPHSPLHTLPAFKRLQVRDLIAHGLYGFTTRPTTADEQAKAVRLWQLAAQDALDMAQAPPSSSSSTPHLRQERINALVMAALDSHLARDWPALERWVHGLEQFAQEVIRTPDVPEPGHWAGHAVMHASYHRRNLALAMHPAPQQQQRLEALIAWASTVPELTQSPLPWLAGAKFHLNEVRQGRAVPDACIAGGLMSCRIWVGSP
jgi:hypothetical protein